MLIHKKEVSWSNSQNNVQINSSERWEKNENTLITIKVYVICTSGNALSTTHHSHINHTQEQ